MILQPYDQEAPHWALVLATDDLLLDLASEAKSKASCLDHLLAHRLKSQTEGR